MQMHLLLFRKKKQNKPQLTCWRWWGTEKDRRNTRGQETRRSTDLKDCRCPVVFLLTPVIQHFQRKGKDSNHISYSVQHGESVSNPSWGAVGSDHTYRPPQDLSQCQLTWCPKSQSPQWVWQSVTVCWSQENLPNFPIPWLQSEQEQGNANTSNKSSSCGRRPQQNIRFCHLKKTVRLLKTVSVSSVSALLLSRLHNFNPDKY